MRIKNIYKTLKKDKKLVLALVIVLKTKHYCKATDASICSSQTDLCQSEYRDAKKKIKNRFWHLNIW